MANRVLTVTAKVRDAASAGLNRIQDSLKRTGGEAKKTAVNFSEFNRVMFATSAYVGLFTKSFSKFGDALLKGAEFNRIQTQFERVMGPNGDLFTSIAGFTDNSIDKVEAMRSAIQLKTLGIAGDTSQIAELIARAGTAGKQAGKDSGEGIKEFTHFLKDGSLASLESLNLLAQSNPALKLQMAMIGKMGGVMGSALTAQMKYNMGMRLLRAATDGAMMGHRDLYDVIFTVRQSFTMLKNEIGVFLGTALSSLIDHVSSAVDNFTMLLTHIRNTKKEILFLAKSLIVLTGAAAGLMATFGTLRLISIGLAALGISTMPLIIGVTTLITLFSALTYKVKEGTTPIERFVEKLRVFGAVVKGVWQLVNSYLSSQDNMRKGIGQIDRDLYELLNKNGLFVFVHKVSQAISVLARFGIGVFKELKAWAEELDDLFGSMGNKFAEFFGVNKKLTVDLDATGNVIDEPFIKRISAHWLDANSKAGAVLRKSAAAMLVAFTAYKVLGIGKGFLSHVPLLGRLFKGTTGKPDGSKSNPIHVIMDSKYAQAMKESILSRLFGKKILGPVPVGGKALGRVGGIVERFMPAPVVRVVNKFVARPVVRVLSAVAAPIVRVISKFIPAPVKNIFKAVATRIPRFGFAANRTGSTATKIAQVARSTVAGTWMNVSNLIASSATLTKVFDFLAGIGTKVSSVFVAFRNFDIGVMFRSLFARAWIGIASRLVGIKDIVTGVIAGFEGLSKGAAALRGFQIIHILIAAFGFLTGVVVGLYNNFSSFTGMFGAAYDYLRSIDYAQMFSDLYDSISSTFSDVANFISETFSEVYDTVSAAIASALAPLNEFGNYLFAKLSEAFGFIAPYIQMILNPIGEVFKVFGGWLSIVGEALKGLYDKLISIPYIGEAIKATVTSIADPFGTFKGLGEMAVGLPAMGADYMTNLGRNATAKNFLDQADNKGTLPFMPATSDDRYDYAKRAMEQASEADKQRMARGMREATKDTSAGGKEITAEEFARIFGIALDNSKIAKHTEETSRESKKLNGTKAMHARRGGC